MDDPQAAPSTQPDAESPEEAAANPPGEGQETKTLDSPRSSDPGEDEDGQSAPTAPRDLAATNAHAEEPANGDPAEDRSLARQEHEEYTPPQPEEGDAQQGSYQSAKVTDLEKSTPEGLAPERAHTSEMPARTVENDPIDVVTGDVVVPDVDLTLPGVLPLVLRRTHVSSYRWGRFFGHTWASTLDQRVDLDGDKLLLLRQDGSVLVFPHPSQGEHVEPREGARLELSASLGEYVVFDPRTGATTRFATGDGASSWLTEIGDRRGNRIRIDRDASGFPTRIRHTGGYTVEVNRTGERIAGYSMLDADGVLSLRGFEFDERGLLAGVRNGSGKSLGYRYDATGRLIAWIDRNGVRYDYTYDEQGRAIRGAGTDGFLAGTMIYEPSERRTLSVHPDGTRTTYLYNERGQVVEVIDPLDRSTRFEPDRYDRVVTRTDALGRVTRWEYDGHGRVVSVSRPGGRVTRARYAGDLPDPEAVTQADGQTWRYAYDGAGDLIRAVDPTGATMTIDYRPGGRVERVIDPVGAITEYETNDAGLVTGVTNAVGGRTEIARDPLGRAVRWTAPDGGVTEVDLTVDDWVHRVRIPTEGERTFEHDPEGNVVAEVDGNGLRTEYDYGPFDRLIGARRPDGSVLTVSYDDRLRIRSLTDPLGRSWLREFNAAGELTAETDVNGRRVEWGRDPLGRVAWRRNASNQRVDYSYDVAGDLTSLVVDGSVTLMTYDTVGRATAARGPGADVMVERDAVGRVIAETLNGRRTTFGYDRAGRLVERVTPAGIASRWELDDLGAPKSWTGSGRAIGFQRDDQGRELTRTLPRGVRVDSVRGAGGRLQSQHVVAGEDGRALAGRSYGFDAAGRLIECTDELRGDRRFELDPMGRVLALTRDGVVAESYGYDSAGVLTRAGLPSEWVEASGEREVEGTRAVRVGQWRYRYDPDGRVVGRTREFLSGRREAWTYAWDGLDRLVRAERPDGSAWEYRYDAWDRRVAKSGRTAAGDGIGAVTYGWEGYKVIEVDGPNGTVTWDFDPVDARPLIERRIASALSRGEDDADSAFYAIVSDLVGTPAELVSEDGEVAWAGRVSLWGTHAGQVYSADLPRRGELASGTLLRFPGQIHDEELGWDYNVHRYYDPVTGSYVSPDPIGLAGGPNPIRYSPNPTTSVDVLGLCPGKPPNVRNNGDAFEDFAHGTNIDSARQIMDNGLSMRSSLDQLYGSRHPGYFFTVPIDQRDRDAALDTAALWGARHQGETAVVVLRLPLDVVTSLEARGHLTRGDIPKEAVFHPDSFDLVNSQGRWFGPIQAE